MKLCSPGEQSHRHGRCTTGSSLLHRAKQLFCFLCLCVFFFLLFGFLWLDKRTFFFQTQLPIKAHYQENLPLHFRTLNEFLS